MCWGRGMLVRVEDEVSNSLETKSGKHTVNGGRWRLAVLVLLEAVSDEGSPAGTSRTRSTSLGRQG